MTLLAQTPASLQTPPPTHPFLHPNNVKWQTPRRTHPSQGARFVAQAPNLVNGFSAASFDIRGPSAKSLEQLEIPRALQAVSAP
jgi:hypothetical protein